MENKEEKGLLLAVLMMLSLSGDEMTEERLWEHLSLLGLDKGTKHHVFGDPGSVLAKFVRQRYLVKVPKKSDSGRIFLYQPGENAQDEIDAVQDERGDLQGAAEGYERAGGDRIGLMKR